MSTITDLDIDKYKNYYFTSVKDDFHLFAVLPNGEEKYTTYDKIVLENGTLICFKEYDDTRSNYELYLRTNNHEEIIQGLCYETFFANIDRWDNSDLFSYWYGNSVDVTKAFSKEYSALGEYRCDFGEYGFQIFHISDGIKNFVIDTSKLNKENIKYANIVFSIAGVATVAICGYNTQSHQNDWPAHTITSKTFYGILKTIIEWNQVSQEPWNNTDLPALRAGDFLSAIGLSNDIISDVEYLQKDMGIKKYLKDPTNARVSDEVVVKVSDVVKNYLVNKFRFKSLNNLIKYKNIKIDNNILNKELSNIEQDLYAFCIINNIGINDLEFLIHSPVNSLNFQLSTKDSIENQFYKFKTIKGS